MKLGLSLSLTLRCDTCGDSLEANNRMAVIGVLFGEKYEYCPNCGSRHHPSEATHRFKVRWTKRRNELLQRAKIEMITI